MGIETIKRWQWILIGIVAGLGLGYVWSSNPDGDLTGASFGQVDFERELMRTNVKTGQAHIRNVVIHPPTVDRYGKNVQPVSYQRMQIAPKGGAVTWQKAHIIAPIPYKPSYNLSMMPKPAKGEPMIRDYLAGVTKKFDKVTWRYGWESERPTTIAIWTAGSTVLIGGIWPTVLNLIAGVGFAAKREPKEAEFSLSSYRPSKIEAKAAEAPDVSQAERDRLDEMNRKLEEQLRHAGVINDGPLSGDGEEDPDGPILAGAGIRKLDAGPLETAAALTRDGDDDEIEVKGEFYPVLIHHKKGHADDEKRD